MHSLTRYLIFHGITRYATIKTKFRGWEILAVATRSVACEFLQTRRACYSAHGCSKKSIIYQLAVVVDARLTAVVITLISFLQDQQSSLTEIGIQDKPLVLNTLKEVVSCILHEVLFTGSSNGSSVHPCSRPQQNGYAWRACVGNFNSAGSWVRVSMNPVVLFVASERFARYKRLISRM